MRSAWLVLALSLLLTGTVTWYARTSAETQDRLRFQNLVQKNQAILQNRMETYIALLRGTAGLFQASDNVSREELRTFVEGLDLRRQYPGIQGIGFGLRVAADWKNAVIEEMRRNGEAKFGIWPDSPRDDLFPIIYLEPLDRRNRAALGFDMFTNPARRVAMERARDTGEPSATGRILLEQEIDPHKQAGFLIYVPVYKKKQPTGTLEERRAALAGFVYSAFRADDLLQGTLGSSPNLAVEVYAGAASPRTLLHQSHAPGVVGPDPQFESTQRFDMAGHPWTVVFSTLPAFEAASIRDQAALLLILGLLMSIALFGVMRSQAEDRAQAETANHAKDRFMATLSHELRTPLTPVLAVLSRLERPGLEALPPSIRNGLATIRRNVELEARLIDDLLDLTRISQSKLELRRGPADLRQVLEHAVEASARPGTPGPQVAMEADGGDLRIWADAPRLTQVFWNLLSNARKFTPPEGTVRVRAWRDGNDLVAQVSDTGMGIEPELLPHVFDAFQQGRRNEVRRFGGLGLGLAIGKSLVELHGGSLSVESEGKGRGSTFTVRLPSGRPASLPEPVREAAPEEPAEILDARPEPLHILLVEDHVDTAEAMADLLRATGHQVVVAGSISEGMAAVDAAVQGRRKDDRIDLVLSDIGLPDGSGLDLMAELSKRYGLRGIALTGYGMEEDVARSRAAGFARHLTKPVNLEQLETAIRQVAGRAATSAAT
ncbi:MAG TPA: CHASE domain-containing protein [Thermoanaerobaculia bacterium]|nr:CHASE domain-containing protein [Thermoanaerobaculia bacterium]